MKIFGHSEIEASFFVCETSPKPRRLRVRIGTVRKTLPRNSARIRNAATRQQFFRSGQCLVLQATSISAESALALTTSSCHHFKL